MRLLNNICKTENICMICTLHQTSNDVLSMIDFFYVLDKGGHNLFWGSYDDLIAIVSNIFGISCDTNQTAIESLVSLSAQVNDETKFESIRETIEREVNNRIELNDDNLNLNYNNDDKLKKFNFKDIFILIQSEIIEVKEYKYKNYLLEIILIITTLLLLANTYGTDIGKYDDCIGLNQNISCEDIQNNMTMVNRNTNYMGMLVWLMSFIISTLAVIDKLSRTKYFYHHRQNS